MRRVNIHERLNQQRDKFMSGAELLQDFKTVLAEDDKEERRIRREILFDFGEREGVINAFNLELLETDNIYYIDQIKRICSIYRLRFLDSHYFKDDLPYEAVRKTKHLQRRHQVTLKGFKIMAPAKSFKLRNADDPLLFAPMGNGYYYLIHKWGRDLHPLRKLAMWPFRNLECMIGFLFLVSVVLTIIFPKDVFSTNLTDMQFWLIVLFMFKWVGGIAVYYLFRKGKNFSPAVWRSHYFNAEAI